MRNGRLKFIVWATLVVGCATAAPNVRPPLAANLMSGALTGAPIPLHFDPNAKVIRSTAANLPPTSYSAAQAARGETVYGNTCGACHQPESLVGQAFVESWSDRRVYDFYALVRSTMPLDNPGGLKDQEYLDVVAYLLKANHAPAGTDSLAADTVALRSHKIAVRFP
jgi:S-disulfanyl-L-cysteine oxidoreductase SoxD